MESLSATKLVWCVFLLISSLLSVSMVGQASTTTFSYTGGEQSYVATSSSLQIDICGAQGGDFSSNGGVGGRYGGCITAIVSVTSGSTLYVYIGGQGGTGSTSAGAVQGGYNGGGAGDYGAGGGGASDVRTTSGDLSSRIIVGAGGGGAGGEEKYMMYELCCCVPLVLN